MSLLKKIFTKENVIVGVLCIVALHPFIELDYLAYELLDTIGLPRLSTIIDYIILPLLVIAAFFLFEKNKKKTLIVFSAYALVFGIWFILHCLSSDQLQYNLYLPNNFVFSFFGEVVYVLTLMIPLVYIWVFHLFDVRKEFFKKVSLTLAVLVGGSIFVANIFMFGFSSYEDHFIGNIFSWFSLPFDELSHHPRFYSSKFYFEQANTIGILMFTNNSFLYYFFLKEKKRLYKILEFGLIVIHSLAMLILSTRVATYGAILIPLMVLAVYIVLCLLRYEKLKRSFLLATIFMIAMTGIILPYSPAYQNQKFDARNYAFQKTDDDQKDSAQALIREGAEGLEKYSEEWFNFYTYAFEEYAFMIAVTPPVYYTSWYPYKHDPQFWVDLIFDYDLEERVNGRQIQTIFYVYKWDELNTYQKALGMGYTTFMNGSMTLERDFAVQFYSFGYVGFVLVMAPWLSIWFYLAFKLILGYKKRQWTFFNVLLMAAFTLGLIASYVSGHTLDQLSTSLFIALCAGTLWGRLKYEA